MDKYPSCLTPPTFRLNSDWVIGKMTKSQYKAEPIALPKRSQDVEEEAKIQNTARVSLHGGICMGSETERTPVRKEHGARKRSRGDTQQLNTPAGKSCFPYTLFQKHLLSMMVVSIPDSYPKGINSYLLFRKADSRGHEASSQ